MAEFRWRRGEGDFAVRVDLETIRGVFQKGVVIEPGCKALLIVDGALVAELLPGEYNEGGIQAKLRNFDLTRFATAILVDVGDVDLRFTVPGLMTRDPMQIDVDCTLVIQVEKPEFFHVNVMKGRSALAREELERRLGVEVQNVLQEVIGQETVEKLNTDLTLKEAFEVQVEKHLRQTFSRAGFGFVQFRTIAYRYRGFDKIRGLREDYYLQITEAEARLDGRKRVFDVFDRNELQTIFEATRKLERDVLQQRERARVLRELNPLLVDEHKSTEQMEQFLLEIEKGKLLRGQELEDLKRTLQEHREDAQTAREVLVRRVALERELQYEEMRLLGREDLELKLLRARAERARAELEEKLADDRMRRVHDREQALQDHIATLDRQLATTKSDLEEYKIAQQIQRGQIEIKKLYTETKIALKVKKRWELALVDLRVREQTLRLQLEEKQRLMEIEQAALDREQQRKVDMVHALANASTEAVIAMAGETQAQMIADLKRVEALRGFSEEQILAMAAGKDPRVAEAFSKKFEGLAKDELELLHNKMLAAERTSKEQQVRVMQEMYNKALETQRDVSMAATGANRPMVVTGAGGYGAAVVTTGAVGEGMFRCTQCGAALQADAKFCHRCGRAVSGAPASPEGSA